LVEQDEEGDDDELTWRACMGVCGRGQFID
jgi:hypothetical protein